MNAIDEHWWIQNKPSVLPFTKNAELLLCSNSSAVISNTKNPLVVKGKGRPAGALNKKVAKSSTKREPSAFEYEDDKTIKRRCGVCKTMGHNSRSCTQRNVCFLS